MLMLAKYLAICALCGISVWVGNYHKHSLFQRVPNLRVVNIPISSSHDIDISRSLSSVFYPEASDPIDDHHNDDGHGADDHSSGHPSLFEALSAIHIEIGTYSVLIIIGFIIILKQLIEGMYAFTHDGAFHGMVKKIEEELMIVGSSSFIFKVVLNTTSFGSNKWAYPLEFGEVLVPLIAFSYCFIGIFLVIVSLKQCFTWSRAHNLNVVEILDDYFTASKTWLFA